MPPKRAGGNVATSGSLPPVTSQKPQSTRVQPLRQFQFAGLTSSPHVMLPKVVMPVTKPTQRSSPRKVPTLHTVVLPAPGGGAPYKTTTVLQPASPPHSSLPQHTSIGIPATTMLATDVSNDTKPEDVPLALLPVFVEMVRSLNDLERPQGALGIRKLLSVDIELSPIDAVVQSGVVPNLVQLAARLDSPTMQLDALWALSNLLSGDNVSYTRLLFCHQVIPLLVTLLYCSRDADIVEQAIWAIGNAAGDGLQTRNYVLSCGVMRPLLRIMNSNEITKPSLMSNAMWALANLLRFAPTPASVVDDSLPTVMLCLGHANTEVVAQALSALDYLTNAGGLLPHLMQDYEDLLLRVVTLADAENKDFGHVALRIVGNIAMSSENSMSLIHAGVLQKITPFLRASKSELSKEACWLLSNIAAEPVAIRSIIDSDVLPAAVQCLRCGINKISKEAAYVFNNIVFLGSSDEVDALMAPELKFLQACSLALQWKDIPTAEPILELVESLLRRSAETTSSSSPGRFLQMCVGTKRLMEAIAELSIGPSPLSEVANRITVLARAS